MSKILNYYKEPAAITNLKKYKEFTDFLPSDPGAVCQVVQGLLVHDMWVTQYGENYNSAHEYPQKMAYMEDILTKALEIDQSSLAIPRHPRDRVIGCCREFATLMCALLRAKQIPARSRCGFAVYFGWDGKYEDHWVCEYWNGERWVVADPQIDPFQQSTIISWAFSKSKDEKLVDKVNKFNPRDIKPNEFITAGQAWKLCREGAADPEIFGIDCPIRPEWGIDTLYGMWFIRGQLIRDFAALNKVETVPYLVRICKGLNWKPWHLVAAKDNELSANDLKLLDRIAEYTICAEEHFDEIRELYNSNKELSVPSEIVMR